MRMARFYGSLGIVENEGQLRNSLSKPGRRRAIFQFVSHSQFAANRASVAGSVAQNIFAKTMQEVWQLPLHKQISL